MAIERKRFTLPDPRAGKVTELTWEEKKVVTELYETFIIPDLISMRQSATGRVFYHNVCDSGCA